MEIKILEQKGSKLQFEIRGENHTLCNILKKELYNDEHVKSATYWINHPLIGVPTFILETDGADPKKTLISAVQRLKKLIEKFSEEFSKAK